MISASISLALTGQSATADNRTIPFETLSTTGASATCRFAILNSSASLYCQISDTKSDGNRPYVEWGVLNRNNNAYGDGDVYYTGGSTGTVTVTDRTSILTIPTTYVYAIYWRVCRDVATTNSDNCSYYLVKYNPL